MGGEVLGAPGVGVMWPPNVALSPPSCCHCPAPKKFLGKTMIITTMKNTDCNFPRKKWGSPPPGQGSEEAGGELLMEEVNTHVQKQKKKKERNGRLSMKKEKKKHNKTLVTTNDFGLLRSGAFTTNDHFKVKRKPINSICKEHFSLEKESNLFFFP